MHDAHAEHRIRLHAVERVNVRLREDGQDPDFAALYALAAAAGIVTGYFLTLFG